MLIKGSKRRSVEDSEDGGRTREEQRWKRTSERHHIRKSSAVLAAAGGSPNAVWKPSPKSIVLQRSGSGCLPLPAGPAKPPPTQKNKPQEIGGFSGVAESR